MEKNCGMPVVVGTVLKSDWVGLMVASTGRDCSGGTADDQPKLNPPVAGAAGWVLKLNWVPVLAGAAGWGTPKANGLAVVATGGVIPYANGFAEGAVVALSLSDCQGNRELLAKLKPPIAVAVDTAAGIDARIVV